MRRHQRHKDCPWLVPVGDGDETSCFVDGDAFEFTAECLMEWPQLLAEVRLAGEGYWTDLHMGGVRDASRRRARPGSALVPTHLNTMPDCCPAPYRRVRMHRG